MKLIVKKTINAIKEPVKICAYLNYSVLKYRRKWFGRAFDNRRLKQVMRDHGLDCNKLNNVIQITGLPRSGTTLISATIANCEKTISLSEPFLQYLQEGFFTYEDKNGNQKIYIKKPECFINKYGNRHTIVAFKETWRSTSHDVFPTESFINTNFLKGIKTVAIIRDPRAIWFSMLNRFSGNGCNLTAIPSTSFLSEWNKYVDWLDSSGVFAFRYEDFVKDPSVFLPILHGLDIEIAHDEIYSLSKISGLGDSKGLSGGVVNIESLEKYRMLDGEAIDMIENACKAGMIKYCYL